MIVNNERFSGESLAPSEVAGHAAVQAQIEALPARERVRLIVLLTLLAGVDEMLADLHLCLPTVDVRFFLLEAPQCREVSLSPAQLLEMTMP